MLNVSICELNCKNTPWKLLPHLPGANAIQSRIIYPLYSEAAGLLGRQRHSDIYVNFTMLYL